MEPLDMGLEELVGALEGGHLRPEPLLEQAIASHDASGRGLNAYLVWDPDRAREAVAALPARRGQLWGVPVSVKDLFGVSGWPTHAGMRRPLSESWQAEGPLVASLRRQGAVLVGKTHMVELAFGGLGTNPHWPVPRNPWDPRCHRVPGGSSSGAGVSLAERSAMLALGTDTAGSVRVPASFTGAVGVKTSPGRWPTGGIVPLSPTLDTVGLLARTARDARWAFHALDGGSPAASHPPLSRCRIGRLETVVRGDLDPGIGEAVDRALEELGRAGAIVESLDLPAADEAWGLFREGGPVAAELASFLRDELPGRRAELDPNVEARVASADQLSAVEYLGRLRRLARVRDAAGGRAMSADVLACPTVAITPPPVEAVADADTYRRQNLQSLRNTSIFSYLGWCAVTLPVGLDREGMPVGLQLAAPPGADSELLEIAVSAERVLGTGIERLGPPPGLAGAEGRAR